MSLCVECSELVVLRVAAIAVSQSPCWPWQKVQGRYSWLQSPWQKGTVAKTISFCPRVEKTKVSIAWNNWWGEGWVGNKRVEQECATRCNAFVIWYIPNVLYNFYRLCLKWSSLCYAIPWQKVCAITFPIHFWSSKHLCWVVVLSFNWSLHNSISSIYVQNLMEIPNMVSDQFWSTLINYLKNHGLIRTDQNWSE